MKKHSLKIHVSEISPEEMKRITTLDEVGVPESGSGCYAVATCSDGKIVSCTTEIPKAKCYIMQISVGDEPFQVNGVMCAGVPVYCSGTDDSGTSGSGTGGEGGQVPPPTPPKAKKL